jgi:hypothetical protein
MLLALQTVQPFLSAYPSTDCSLRRKQHVTTDTKQGEKLALPYVNLHSQGDISGENKIFCSEWQQRVQYGSYCVQRLEAVTVTVYRDWGL